MSTDPGQDQGMSPDPEPAAPDSSEPSMTRRALLIGAGVVGVGALGVAGGYLFANWPLDEDDDDEVDDEIADDVAEELTPDDPVDVEETPTPEATPTPEPTPTPEASPTPTPIAVPDEPVAGGVMRIALPEDPFSLHPNADESTTNWVVMSQIYNALMEVDHDFDVVPSLAESYEIAEDGSTVTFDVREDVLFHNGAELTAHDVTHTHAWMQVGDQGAGRSFYYERIEHIEAPDDYTVVFHFSGPDGSFLRRAASTFVVNAEEHDDRGSSGYSLEPIGTGPFSLQSWDRDQSLTLERFEEYHGETPYLDGIEFEIMPDSMSRLDALDTGNVDAVYGLSSSVAIELAEGNTFQSVEVVNLDCSHIALNNEHPILGNENVRRAILYGIDRGELVDLVYDGAATPATSYLSPALEHWHEGMIEPDRPLTERAIELLEEAGWTEGDDGIRELDGERLSFTCAAPEDDPRLDGAERISEMLREIGVEMEIDPMNVGAAVEQMRAGELDAALFNWTYGGGHGDPDSRTTLQTGAFNNFSQFSSVQVDNMLHQGIGEVDQEARRSIYRGIQERIANQAPFIFLMFPHSFYHFSQRIQGLPESANWGSRLFRLTGEFWIFE